jgi:hypothetical protein
LFSEIIASPEGEFKMNISRGNIVWFVLFSIFIYANTALAERFSDLNLVVQMKGKGGFEYPSPKLARLLPPGAGGCFVTNLVNPNSDWVIGKAYDCLLGAPNPIGEEGGFTIQTAYMLDFQGKGTLVTINTVTVQPALDASPEETGITHIVGDFPAEQTIFSGSRIFKKAKGSVRVSGGNDLRELDLLSPDTSFITFDYIFVVSLGD